MNQLSINTKKLGDYDYMNHQKIKVKNYKHLILNTSVVQTNLQKEQGLIIAKLSKPYSSYFVLLSMLLETFVCLEYKYHFSIFKSHDFKHPSGIKYIYKIKTKPYPKIYYRFGMFELIKEYFLSPQKDTLFIRYRLSEAPTSAKLVIEPLLAFRETKKLAKMNQMILPRMRNFENGFGFSLYKDFPELKFLSDSPLRFISESKWIKNIKLIEKNKPQSEDLYHPGKIIFTIKKNKPIILSVGLEQLSFEEINKAYEREVFT